jgi:signal transduction histidine kinase
MTVFLVSTILTFAAGVTITYQSLKSDDRSEIQSKAEQLYTRFRNGGLPGMRAQVERDNAMGRDRPYFVRLSDSKNRTIFSSIPREWRDFGFARLEHRADVPASGFTVLNSPDFGYSVEILNRTIEGGYLLQVGGSTRGREHVILSMIRTFILITLPAIVMLLIFLWWFSKSLLHAVSDILKAAEKVIETGRYEKSLPERGIAREFDQLADLFNRMFTTLNGLNVNLRSSLTSIAHEVRTPMTRLQMKAEFALRDGASEEERSDALEACIKESETITALLQRILDTSEAESGLLTLHQKRSDLGSLCRELSEMYEYLGLSEDITIRYQGPDSLEAVIDPPRIHQVASNLLDNALKHSPPGSTVLLGLETDKRRARLFVADEGPGIRPEDMKHLWSYGFRSFGESSTEGYGLGLTLVKAIVEAHGGTVSARNLGERGCEFSVYLPLQGSGSVPALNDKGGEL